MLKLIALIYNVMFNVGLTRFVNFEIDFEKSSTSFCSRRLTGVPTKHATYQIVLPIIYLHCFKGKFRVRVGVGEYV